MAETNKATAPAFDPDAPVDRAPAFDPSAPVERVPAFDPNAPVDKVDTKPPAPAPKLTEQERHQQMMEASRKRMAEELTGLASGAAQTVVGAGQLGARLTGASDLEQYLAETQQTLKKYGTPGYQTAGEFIPYLFPWGRGLGMAGRVVGAVPGIAKTAEYLAPRIAGATEYLAPYAARAAEYIPTAEALVPEKVLQGYRWLKNRGVSPKAAPEAAVAEGAVSAAQATEGLNLAQKSLQRLKEGFKEGLATSGKELTKGAATGATVGAGMGTIAPRAEKTQQERDQARWNEIVHGIKMGTLLGAGGGAASAFLKGINTTFASMSLSEQRKAVEEAEKILAQQQEELAKTTGGFIEKEQKRMDTAKEIKLEAETAVAPTEKKIEELAQAARKAEERELYESTAAEARELAKQTGMTARQAEAHVAEKQAILDDAKVAADKIAADFAARPTAMTKNELGAAIQESAAAMEEKLENIVKKNSGYAELEQKYAGGEPVFPIAPIVEKIEAEVKAGLAGSDASYFLSNLRSRLEESAKQLGDQGRVSFRQIDEARKEVNDAITKGIIQKSGGARTSAGSDLTKFEPVQQAIRQSMIATDKTFEKVLDNYAKLKEPLAPYEKGGVFEGATEKLFGSRFAMSEGDVAAQVLKRAGAGSEGLAQLIAEDKSLQDKVRQYLNSELFGVSEESAAKVTSAKFDKFKKQYGEVIDRAGLTAEFDTLASSRKAVEQRIAEAERGVAEAKTEAQQAAEKLALEKKRRAFETKGLEEAAAPYRKTAKEAASEIESAKKQQEFLETLQSDIRRVPVDKVGSRLEDYIKKLRDKYPETLTKQKYDTLQADLKAATKEYERTRDALKLAQDVRTYLVTRGLTMTGMGLGGGYGLYRLGRGGE